jgi:sterol desaturase/sphingolipid hydroxylase (fatty acid hydroxylase superfamily)
MLVLYMIVFIPLERLFFLSRQNVFRKEFLVDLGYYFFNPFLSKLILILPTSIVLWAVHHFVQPSGLYTLVGSLPVSTRFVLAIIIGDIGAYWGHRWCHEIPLLWRFHAIHHSAKEIDWLVNTRGHPLDIAFTRFSGLIPIYLIGLAQPMYNRGEVVMIVYVLFGSFWSFIIHANVRWRLGWFEQVLSTPAFHHWHHTNDGAKYINKNYAAIFPWIDKLFGSFYLPRNRWPEKYGIDAPTSPNLMGQLLQPLEINLPEQKN